nr:MAG TPA: hypothetical protein [Bacteriophage sp.]
MSGIKPCRWDVSENQASQRHRTQGWNDCR